MKEVNIHGDVVIATKLHDDFIRYLSNYRRIKNKGITDGMSKLFSSNNRYEVYAIKIVGSEYLYDKL